MYSKQMFRYAGQKNKSKKVESSLNPEFEFTTGYVTEEGGPNELFIGKLECLIFTQYITLFSKNSGTMTLERMRVWDMFSLT